MSEKLVLPPQETQIPSPQHLGPEAGAINFSELANRGNELARDGVDASKVAYHGLRSAVANVRMQRAEKARDRMERKAALYTELGDLAVSGSATPPSIKPKNVFERMRAARIDKRGLELSYAETRKRRAEKIFGPEASLPGLTSGQRKLRKLGVTYAHLKGRSSAYNARIAKTNIGAEPVKHGLPMHKVESKRMVKERKKLDILTDTKYYEMRRDKAAKKANKHRSNARKHGLQATVIRRPLIIRRAARKAARTSP